MVSDCKVFLGSKDHFPMSTSEVTAGAGGDLRMHVAMPGPSGCNQMDADYLKVGSEGHYRAPALGFLDVRIATTDYHSFGVVYIYKELDGVRSILVQLFSRTQDASPEAMEAFQDVYRTVGLSDDMMAMMPKSDVCPAGGQEAP
ncbi:lipocalin-15 isoform X2 [Dasypus novemcinctus]